MLTRKITGDSILFFEDDVLFLTIDETDTDGQFFISLKGELRSEIANHIQDELDAFTTADKQVMLDFSGITYISFSAMNALFYSQKLVDFLGKGRIILRSIPDPIYQKMDEKKITEMLWIED